MFSSLLLISLQKWTADWWVWSVTASTTTTSTTTAPIPPINPRCRQCPELCWCRHPHFHDYPRTVTNFHPTSRSPNWRWWWWAAAAVVQWRPATSTRRRSSGRRAAAKSWKRQWRSGKLQFIYIQLNWLFKTTSIFTFPILNSSLFSTVLAACWTNHRRHRRALPRNLRWN